MCNAYSFLIVGIGPVDGEVGDVHDETNTVNGGDKNTVGVHERHGIEHPHDAVHDPSYIWVKFELLNIFVLQHSPNCWPVIALTITLVTKQIPK